MNQPVDHAPSPDLTGFDRIFRDRNGQIVIGQPPNLPLGVALTATLLSAILPDNGLQAAVELVSFGAWFTWGWLELFDGVNYFRRALGLVTLVGILTLKLSVG